MSDVRTRPYHPQSNGLDEGVHRTIREEVPLLPEAALYQVQQLVEGFRAYHNEQRSRSTLRYLRPVDRISSWATQGIYVCSLVLEHAQTRENDRKTLLSLG